MLAQVVALRHDEGLSWAKIADTLNLGSPGTARRAYRQATELQVTERLPRLPGKGGRPTDAEAQGEEAVSA